MSISNLTRWLLALSAGLLFSCKQSDPPTPNTSEKGDFSFSGYDWKYKNSSGNQVGPGPNLFSSSSDNIWLDQDSMLHLKITKRNGLWYCSEVISTKEFGYGTFIFTTQSDLTTLNEKSIFGLFSWNDYSFYNQGNSEVDIEFARWNNANDSLLLTYSVQPVWFDNASPYAERTRRPQMQVNKLKTTSTHVFRWTPDSVTWKSYEGSNYPGINLLASWAFDKTNPARTKIEGGITSAPIIIPAPDDSTNVRLNLWLLNGQAPSNGTESEVVIKSFRYIPL